MENENRRRVVRKSDRGPRPEKKGLAITGFVLGIIAIIGSWIPIINNISFVFAIIALIFALLALLINRKRKKTFSFVGLVLAVLSIIIVLVTQNMFGKALDDASKKVNTAISSSQKKAEDSFKWTLAGYDTTLAGDTLTGIGGTNYDDIVNAYGKPSSTSDSSSGDYTTRTASWNNVGAKDLKSVTLTFKQQADDTFLLSGKYQSGLD